MIQVPNHLLFMVCYYWCFSSNKSLRRPFHDVPEEDDDLLFLLKAFQHKRGEVFVHSRYRKVFYRSLSSAAKRLRDKRIPRIALQDPSKSAWRTLYTSNNDQALIVLTGLDHATFGWLHQKFEIIYKKYTPFGDEGKIRLIKGVGGRPRLMSAADALGLVLAWTRTRGSQMVLGLIFGMGGTSVSIYIRFARRIVVLALKSDPDAAVSLPSLEKIREYQSAIAEKYPALSGVWCTMDGLKLRLQQSGDFVIQAKYYNGWTHDHYVSSVFVFCPDGTIAICSYNLPGILHDSTIAEWGGVYKKLKAVYEMSDGKCTVDSAFNCRKYGDFLIKSSQSNPYTNNLNDYLVNRDATSMRQAAEWGMRMIQSSFPRMKDRFVYEEYGERRVMMKMLLLLYNLRARRVGINQILNTYMPNLRTDANKEFVPPLVA